MLTAVRRAAWVGAVLVLAAIVVLPSASAGNAVARQEATITGYDLYSLTALATGVGVEATSHGLLPVDQLVGLATGTAESHFETGRVSATATLPDPGNLLLSAPGLVAGLTNVPNLPSYPASATANYPGADHGHIDLVPAGLVGSGQLDAQAGESGAAAIAAINDFVSANAGVPGITVGEISTHATSKRLNDTEFEASASSVVHDINVEGALRIGAVESTATAHFVDGAFEQPVVKVQVTGATLAGTPVAITDKGIEAPGSAVALAPIIDALAAPLATLGVSVRTTPTQQSSDATTASADGGALEIQLDTNVEGYPVHIIVRLGEANVVATVANPITDETATPVDDGQAPVNDFVAPSFDSSGSSIAPAATQPTPSKRSTATKRRTTSAGTPQLIDTTLDVRSVYRWLALAALALVVGQRVLRVGAAPKGETSDLQPHWRW